jgi:hypothetical protein
MGLGPGHKEEDDETRKAPASRRIPRATPTTMLKMIWIGFAIFVLVVRTK